MRVWRNHISSRKPKLLPRIPRTTWGLCTASKKNYGQFLSTRKLLKRMKSSSTDNNRGSQHRPITPFLQEFTASHFNNLFQPTRRWDADTFDATNINGRSNYRFQQLPQLDRRELWSLTSFCEPDSVYSCWHGRGTRNNDRHIWTQAMPTTTLIELDFRHAIRNSSS